MKPLDDDEEEKGPWKRRLDRIVLRKDGKWQVVDMGLYANKPIYESTKKNINTASQKVMKQQKKTQKSNTLSKEDYLFMSDHFGVYVKFRV